jgi:hypothetical protein
VAPSHATQLLPTVGRLNTVTWVPRRLRSAAGQVFARLTHVAAACATLPHTEDEDFAHLLLVHAPQLIMRLPPTQSEGNIDDDNHDPREEGER